MQPSERLIQRHVLVWLATEAQRIGPHGYCVNIGTWCGATACALALGGPTVVAIDTFTATDAHTGAQALERIKPGTLSTFTAFVNYHNHMPQPIRILAGIGRSADVAKALGREEYDLVFLDGDHSLTGVRDDLAAWTPMLKRDGLLCGHDLAIPSVKEAVEQFVADSGWPIIGYEPVADIWWTRKSCQWISAN
jgi:predicted O-methyltransferase YrrM